MATLEFQTDVTATHELDEQVTQMSLSLLAILIFLAAVFLIAAEIALPTHGILGVLGGIGVLVAIGICFAIDPTIGLIVFLAAVAALPFVGWGMIKLWPKTPVGRRLILQPAKTPPAPLVQVPPVQIGQRGTTISEMRPLGHCDFGDQRLEAISELGLISRGKTVKVVRVEGGRPVVREVQAAG